MVQYHGTIAKGYRFENSPHPPPHPRHARRQESGGDDHHAKRPRTVYACPDQGKSAREVMLADLSQGDARSRMLPILEELYWQLYCPTQVSSRQCPLPLACHHLPKGTKSELGRGVSGEYHPQPTKPLPRLNRPVESRRQLVHCIY